MEITLFTTAMLLIMLLIDAWIIYSVFRSNKSGLVKAAWAAFVLIVPIVGWATWGIAGPRGIVRPPSSPGHSKG
ncbi:PLDc N-terminal domain-containing protein [Pseudomonas syringae pv. syringae]|uniref:PLDc N-terminal domain-containing protein n=1 Tax=Pseudomonas syringae TaxID=317 RepID=UPI00234217EC|nr:PLDc N-terminal domain-containing protein [Pseudomonas syringae]MDC3743564.1 PLDc N-terminal domain-containing protein [Pseudomonas syringae pv. syringae]